MLFYEEATAYKLQIRFSGDTFLLTIEKDTKNSKSNLG